MVFKKHIFSASGTGGLEFESPHFDQIKMPKTVDFTGFSAFFVFYVSSLKFEGVHITDHNKNFLSLKYKLDRHEITVAVFHTD